MPTPTFKRLSTEQFARLLHQFPFTRRIESVHLHHTRQPDHAQFQGHESIARLWRLHTETLGLGDIAQHLTIDPDGFVWLGRNWNQPPASVAGHNGNTAFGPFMLSLIGDFDIGRDRFAGPQQDAALDVIAQLQSRFELPAQSLRLHHSMSARLCPETTIDPAQLLAAVDAARTRLSAAAKPAARKPARGPFPQETDRVVMEAIEDLSRMPSGGAEPADAELWYVDQNNLEAHAPFDPAVASYRPPGKLLARGDSGLGPALLSSLRPHLVNLRAGRFSDAGEATTTAADVDAMFDEHLKAALTDAKAHNRKLRILFFAHGGLVSESSGLQIAARHINWWQQNGIYPVYFIWETGLFETLGQLLERARSGPGGQRGFFDWTSDWLLERGARALQGPRIWGGMKWSAERAFDAPSPVDAGGGARYVATRLKAFCDAHAADIELHAAGHSAGSIFHTHFLAAAQALGVPTFASAHFLAPAVRVDTFKQLLGKRIGDGKAVRHLSIFTMNRDYERDDHCAYIYRKSLLYLIYQALENERETPILGLEESIRGDSELKRLFGLDGRGSKLGSVVWSVTRSDSGASASTADTHGGFDDDAATMNSVLRRVLGLADADRIVGYGEARSLAPAPAARPWVEEVDWPQPYYAAPAAPAPAAAPPLSIGPSWPAAPALPPPEPVPAPTIGLSGRIDEILASGGRRRALCVGIDEYPDAQHRLAGCVADARLWEERLRRLGFSTSVLLDAQATRERIDRELRALVAGSRAGDVIVFQYAGHGTHVADLDGDETDDGRDEALCPVDFAAGALYIDDDIAEVLGQLPAGVNLTCFTDCCHSGTNTRFAVGRPTGNGAQRGRDERRRFVIATPAIEQAHAAFRSRLSRSRTRPAASSGQSLMRDIKFAACLDSEVAWESDGHGEFTLRAARLLDESALALSNEQFLQRIDEAFGPRARQHPLLDCPDAARSRPLLQPLVRTEAGAAAQATGTAAGTTASIDPALLKHTLASIQQLLAQLAGR